MSKIFVSGNKALKALTRAASTIFQPTSVKNLLTQENLQSSAQTSFFGVDFSAASTAGKIRKTNQDVALCGISTNKDFAKNPGNFLQKLGDKICKTLGDDAQFTKSGTTFSIGAIVNGALHVVYLGDSPVFVAANNGANTVSFQLTLDHALSNPEIRKNFNNVEVDSRGQYRLEGTNVVCAGHGNKFAGFCATYFTHKLDTAAKMAQLYGIQETQNIAIVVACDGLLEANQGSETSMFSFIYADSKELKLHYPIQTKSNFQSANKIPGSVSLSDLLFKNNGNDNTAKILENEALENANSYDNVSSCVVKGPVQKLIELSRTQPIVTAIFDGNGTYGDKAAQLAAQITTKELELEKINDMPLALGAVANKNDKEIQRG